MNKKIGFVFIIIALVIGIIAAVNRMIYEKIVTEVANQTGSCYIGGTCLHDQSNLLFFSLIGISIAMLVIGALIFMLARKKESQKPVEKTIPVKEPTNLTDEQKKIYDILLASEGSMLQGELVDKSGMNKVRVSRVLDKMEMKGIIERRRHGMSNIVVLKKN